MPLSRHRCVEVAAPYKLRINKFVQTSRADDIRPYAIMLICNIKTWLCQPARHTELKLIYNTKKELRTAVPFLLFRFLLYIRPCAGDAQWVRRRNSRGLSSRLRAGFRADSTRAVTFCPLRCRISSALYEPRPSPNRRRGRRASYFRARSCRPQQTCLRSDPRARERRSARRNTGLCRRPLSQR